MVCSYKKTCIRREYGMSMTHRDIMDLLSIESKNLM